MTYFTYFDRPPGYKRNNEVVVEFDEEAQLKIEIIQTLLEPCDRDLFTPLDKKTRKERQKEEQTELSMQKKIIKTQAFDEIEEEENVTPATTEISKVEGLDYEDLLDG
ncbi:MAG: hypothetical protein QNJ72_38295 [Pleurocapsa sp. MO_226.B13]|nr:hypothetical protein [Pleurocapsa sp. MO_226.B13]